jgi:hypothetical protein
MKRGDLRELEPRDLDRAVGGYVGFGIMAAQGLVAAGHLARAAYVWARLLPGNVWLRLANPHRLAARRLQVEAMVAMPPAASAAPAAAAAGALATPGSPSVPISR